MKRQQNYGQIISGVLKGRKILFNPKAKELRPTRRVMREALFSAIYTQLNRFEGLRALDAFCGSGIIGLEFLSRGAKFVDLVDLDEQNFQQFRKNIVPFKSHIEERFRYWHGRVSWVLNQAETHWDVAWFDPPFAAFPEPELTHLLEKRRCTLFGLHVHKSQADRYLALLNLCGPDYQLVYEKTYGVSWLCLLRLRADLCEK